MHQPYVDTTQLGQRRNDLPSNGVKSAFEGWQFDRLLKPSHFVRVLLAG